MLGLLQPQTGNVRLGSVLIATRAPPLARVARVARTEEGLLVADVTQTAPAETAAANARVRETVAV